MEETEAIGSEAGDVLVVHKVLTLEAQDVVFFPVAANGQNLVCAFNQGNYVWQRNAGLFAVIVFVFISGQAQVNVALIQCVPVVVHVAEAGLFVLGLLDVCLALVSVWQLDVAVEASLLELDDLVLGLAHDVCHAVAGVQVCRAVGQDDVFCWDEHRHLAIQAWVEVHLLES